MAYTREDYFSALDMIEEIDALPDDDDFGSPNESDSQNGEPDPSADNRPDSAAADTDENKTSHVPEQVANDEIESSGDGEADADVDEPEESPGRTELEMIEEIDAVLSAEEAETERAERENTVKTERRKPELIEREEPEEEPDSASDGEPDRQLAPAVAAPMEALPRREEEEGGLPMSAEMLDKVWFRSTGVTVLTVLAVLYTLYFARDVLFLLVMSFVGGFLFRPMVRWLAKRHVPVTAGSALVVLGSLFAVGLGIYTLSDPAMKLADGLPDRISVAREKLKFISTPLQYLSDTFEKIENFGAGAAEDPTTVTNDDAPIEVTQKKSRFFEMVGGAGAALGSVAVIVVLTFLFLMYGDTFLNKVVEQMPTFQDKRGVVQLVREMERGISRYLFNITVINCGLGVVIGVAMWILGMRTPALWGAMAALFNFVPYLGAGAGTLIVFIVALTEPDFASSTLFALVVPIVYFGITAIEGNVITPMVLGRSMSLNPIMVFLSLTVWGWMWNVGGVLLAVPILGITKIICDHFTRLKPIGKLLEQ